MSETDPHDVDEVWLGSGMDESIQGEQFVEALEAVEDVQEALREAQATLADMETGLDREDTIRLLKGRNLGTALDDIEAVFEAMEAVIEADPEEIAPRLIQSKASDLTIEEAAEIFGELTTLAEKYGSLNTQTDDSDP